MKTSRTADFPPLEYGGGVVGGVALVTSDPKALVINRNAVAQKPRSLTP